ncbi:MAG: methylenetetrahydrofolate--tRNA-(uracil(54)-C(5))-methyltransferase (FADH(2)-oxidizing) TrmFO [Thermodesulfobacteriota bacterium]
MTNTKHDQPVTIIGGGLAGSEAAWQLARRNIRVRLYEMRPTRYSPAHSSDGLAELVCSNSLRSSDLFSAVGLLKEEMRHLDSLVMKAADHTAVPAGKALAVNRDDFSAMITETLERCDEIEIIREEITSVPEEDTGYTIIATGPLTSDLLAESLTRITGGERLFFYDAIAPIIHADSLNRDIIYQKSRYDDGPGDYLNCPMDREQYLAFINGIKQAPKVPLKDFEDEKYFEGCLPVEVMISRGDDTLRYGPMKPVGLADPRTGRDPYGVVQLRMENRAGTLYNMVGFQTKLTHGAQKEIFRTIPGMENCEFARLGSIHRNTFLCAPELLLPTLQLKARSQLFIAGQLSGVEGYVESSSMGILAGLNCALLMEGSKPLIPPPATALGALINHLTATSSKHFQPSNVNFGLFPPWEKKVPKRMRGQKRAETALDQLRQWQMANNIQL